MTHPISTHLALACCAVLLGTIQVAHADGPAVPTNPYSAPAEVVPQASTSTQEQPPTQEQAQPNEAAPTAGLEASPATAPTEPAAEQPRPAPSQQDEQVLPTPAPPTSLGGLDDLDSGADPLGGLPVEHGGSDLDQAHSPAIQRAISTMTPSIRACIPSTSAADATGVISVQVVFGANGRVQSATLTNDGNLAPRHQRCVVRAARRVRTTSLQGTEVAEVRVPVGPSPSLPGRSTPRS